VEVKIHSIDSGSGLPLRLGRLSTDTSVLAFVPHFVGCRLRGGGCSTPGDFQESPLERTNRPGQNFLGSEFVLGACCCTFLRRGECSWLGSTADSASGLLRLRVPDFAL
jgi:hypothetical protein